MYVPPFAGTFQVFAGTNLPPTQRTSGKADEDETGDILQYITNSYLLSTPHRVALNTVERFAIAYFHEPNFRATARPLPGFDGGQTPREGIHYGTHFTNMFVRSYPDRTTTKRLLAGNQLALLGTPSLRTFDPVGN